ncbi:flavodoxin domain-containing protein [Acidisoma cellulosilytica]|uniref:Sulfite reductase [NADPH] flavoprotein alpha-component n=1 Tax=Acidisoma cellulosilyticum TaxID=2802395 RepID=A0A963YXU9_9PROT|nr:flavodoxin domain-containing protein [Acidisoma cellulosilyticum]MCB8879232.1 flavodoxin domain-containing protein [Acidisoma cellulosilyticum]
MASLPILPSSAPFRPEEIAALNGVITKTSPEQRAWLSGFLAGFLAGTGGAQTATAAAPQAPAKKVPLLILFATESGNAETLAAQTRKAAQKLGFAAKVSDVADISLADMAKAENVLIIVSTWGEGDPPQRAMDFYSGLLAEDAPRFDKTRFSLLALGDRAYVNFCMTGHIIDERLVALGAKRFAPLVECDVDFATPANAWIKSTLDTLQKETADEHAVIHVDFARAAPAEAETDDEAEPLYTRNTPFAATISELINLNGSGSSSETWHTEISVEGSGLVHAPGDALGIVPENDPALVEDILKVAGLTDDALVREALSDAQDITTLTRPQVEAYAKLTDSAQLKALTADPNALTAWLQGRQVIDLLEAAPTKLDATTLTSLLRPLPGRLYSIASSAKAAEDEVHLLVSAVRYQTHGRSRAGVASVDIAERRKKGGSLKVYLKPNPHFRLPADPDRAVIMIGPGTGVAPFRAFMQEREAIGATGKNWLFFGNRHFTNDFLYQLEWQDWKKSGLLTRIETAFSRDQREKVYVQNRIWEQRRELYRWIQNGAAIYVCGDANAMAKDVNHALIRVIADQAGIDETAAAAKLDTIRRDGRYLRDVY